MIDGFDLIKDALDFDEDAVTDNIEITKIEDLGREEQLSSKFYSKIFDTEYYWDLPYVIDVAKYKAISPSTRLTKNCETRTVNFSCDIRRSWSELHFVLFVYAEDYDETKDNYDYDCFQFDENDDITINGETKNCTVETFIEKIKELTGAIISIDKEHVKEMISNKERTKEIIQNDIDLLTKFIL